MSSANKSIYDRALEAACYLFLGGLAAALVLLMLQVSEQVPSTIFRAVMILIGSIPCGIFTFVNLALAFCSFFDVYYQRSLAIQTRIVHFIDYYRRIVWEVLVLDDIQQLLAWVNYWMAYGMWQIRYWLEYGVWEIRYITWYLHRLVAR